MRVSTFGWLAATALLACGGEAPPPPALDVPAEEAAAPAERPRETTSAEPPAAEPPPPGAPPAAPEKLGPPYPIVLLHGMGGFGRLEVGPLGVTYFKGVVEDLTKQGEDVYAPLAPPYASTETRADAVAEQLDRILERSGKAKVNLVAHSQGGLDARVVASPGGLGYGDRVASITTIATPHRGSKVADAALGLAKGLPASVVDDVTAALLSMLQKTAYELESDPALRAQLTSLSEAHMRDVFNPRYQDDPRVVYRSYAGRTNLRAGVVACSGSAYPNEPWRLDAVQAPLLATALLLEAGGLAVNDGMVTVESAKWGTFEQCVPADHMKEVGQLGLAALAFDHVGLYRDVVARVRAAGL